MNLALTQGMSIFNDAITLQMRKRIPVRHEVPEHTEICETMNIQTDFDYTNWNPDIQAWQCQFCQRAYDTNTKEWRTEYEYKEER